MPLEGRTMTGRVVVMSGAPSGLGLEAARAFANMGATVEILARNEAKAEATCAALRRSTGNAKVGFVVVDTGSLAALRRAAGDLLRRHPAIHALIHNAGALDDVRQTSPEGTEFTVASQVGPFLLTGLLLPALDAASPSRVLWVSSGGMCSEPVSVDQLEMGPMDYVGTTAYARQTRRSRSWGYWRRNSKPIGSSCMRCSRAGRTRQAWPGRCRRFTASSVPCCERLKTAPTRWSGLP
jgi:NAD(P)-dependent dehydrogenase (short-subunit alcohol dehydrogenase family)